MARCEGSCKKAEIKIRFLRVFNAEKTRGGKDCRPPSWNQKLVALQTEMDEEVGRTRRTLERRTRQCARGCRCVLNRENPEWTKWDDVYIEGKFIEGSCRWKVHGAIQIKWRMRNGKCKSAPGKVSA